MNATTAKPTNESLKLSIEFEGKAYTLTRLGWKPSNPHLPLCPENIARRLNMRMAEMAMDPDAPSNLLSHSIEVFKGTDRGLELAMLHCNRFSMSCRRATVCAALRRKGRLQDAVDQARLWIRQSANEALLTTLAATLCDMGEYREACSHVRHAMALSAGFSSNEALNVMRRIQKERPGIWEATGTRKSA